MENVGSGLLAFAGIQLGKTKTAVGVDDRLQVNTAKGTIGKRELTDAEDSRVEQLVGISKSKGKIATKYLSLIHISEPTRPRRQSRMPSSA
mgnify:CR=1 FL=1